MPFVSGFSVLAGIVSSTRNACTTEFGAMAMHNWAVKKSGLDFQAGGVCEEPGGWNDGHRSGSKSRLLKKMSWSIRIPGSPEPQAEDA